MLQSSKFRPTGHGGVSNTMRWLRWFCRLVVGIVFERLIAQGEKIMSAISEFAAKQTEHNNRLSAAIEGIVGDIAALNAKIEELKTTPEDQALLNELGTQGEALAAKAEALDALTPPAPPVG